MGGWLWLREPRDLCTFGYQVCAFSLLPNNVRLRTDAATENAPTRLSSWSRGWALNWRAINGPNQLLLLIAGERFVDGKLQRQPNTEAVAAQLNSTDSPGRISTKVDPAPNE